MINANLTVTDGLKEAWTAASRDGNVRALAIDIDVDEETINLTDTIAPAGDAEADFNALAERLGDTEPAMFLVCLDTETSTPGTQWCLASYVPDDSHIKKRMLYASGVTDLRAALSIGVTDDFHTSVKGEFTWSELQDARRVAAPDDALTAAEKEAAKEMRQSNVERGAGAGAGAGSGGGGGDGAGGLPFKLAQGATDALKRAAAGEVNFVELVFADDEFIDAGRSEKVSGGAAGMSSLVNTEEPRFLVVNASDGKDDEFKFVYACPDEAPIRQKMVYSTGKTVAVQLIKAAGVSLAERPVGVTIEASKLAEMFVEELGTSNAPEETAADEDDLSFSKPTRPGRGKARVTRKKKTPLKL